MSPEAQTQNRALQPKIDSYIHRIGRCGRAGREGTAVTFAGSLCMVLVIWSNLVENRLAGMKRCFLLIMLNTTGTPEMTDFDGAQHSDSVVACLKWRGAK